MQESERIYYDSNNLTYSIISKIDNETGGFSQVYLAERDDHKLFCIKVLKSEKQLSFGQEKYMLENEAKAMKIQDENVIKYIYFNDGIKNPDLPQYLIMEYANNGNLTSLLNEHKKNKLYFNNQELFEMFLQLSKGMKAINAFIVHRDIKPDNILISDNILKITDFGICKQEGSNTRHCSKTFKGYHTERYFAPEGWVNGENTLKMDIYSMGIVFYELASLNYPYDLNNMNYREAHLTQAPKSIRKYNSEIDDNLELLIYSMINKKSQERPSDWDTIIRNLESNCSNKRSSVTEEIAKSFLKAEIISNIVHNCNDARIKSKNLVKQEYREIIDYSFKTFLIAPLIEICKIHNEKSLTSSVYWSYVDSGMNGDLHDFTLSLPDNSQIDISTKVLFEDDYPKRYEVDYYEQQSCMEFGVNIPSEKIVDYPKYLNKKILAYGMIVGRYSRRGYNLFLIQDDENDLYGNWYKMYNKNMSRYGHGEEGCVFDYEYMDQKRDYVWSRMLNNYTLDSFDIKQVKGIIDMISMYENQKKRDKILFNDANIDSNLNI